MPDYPELETVGLSALAGKEATITAVRKANTKFGDRYVVELNSTGGTESEAQTWVATTGRRGQLLASISVLGQPVKVRFEAEDTGKAKPFIAIEMV